MAIPPYGYQQLQESSKSDSEDIILEEYVSSGIHKSASCPHHARKLSKLLFAFSVLVNGLFASYISYVAYNTGPSNLNCSQILYSPAQEALRYEARKFPTGFGKDISIYQQEPSPMVDEAWGDLYNDFGIIRIPKEQAAQLPNKTYPFAQDKGYYIGEISVFHQLHCLNIIRKSLFPDYYQRLYTAEDYGVNGTLGPGHVSHCIESLRQSLMCASDISIIVWQWNEVVLKAQPHGGIVHTCRDFDRLREWAQAHKAIAEFDEDVFVEDDIFIEGF